MPQRFDLGNCTLCTLSSTGRRIAFTPYSNETWTWKRYRGGTAPDIWVGDLNANTFSNLTENDANDLFPMWMIGRVYFISDRDGTANLFSDMPEGGDLKQHTTFTRAGNDPTDPNSTTFAGPAAKTGRGAPELSSRRLANLLCMTP